MSNFTWNVDQHAAYTLVTLVGRLDLVAAEAFEKEIVPLADHPGQVVFAELSKLDYISSAGLRSLLLCAKTAQRNQGKVCLIGVHDMILDVLRVSGFLSIFETYSSVDAAASSLM